MCEGGGVVRLVIQTAGNMVLSLEKSFVICKKENNVISVASFITLWHCIFAN